jgi:hypothetical protein
MTSSPGTLAPSGNPLRAEVEAELEAQVVGLEPEAGGPLIEVDSSPHECCCPLSTGMFWAGQCFIVSC